MHIFLRILSAYPKRRIAQVITILYFGRMHARYQRVNSNEEADLIGVHAISHFEGR